jgi:hypothetical protein
VPLTKLLEEAVITRPDVAEDPLKLRRGCLATWKIVKLDKFDPAGMRVVLSPVPPAAIAFVFDVPVELPDSAVPEVVTTGLPVMLALA